jgi:plastocyanin
VFEVSMRRPLAALSLLAVALLLSACAASVAPGWTFAPPTPAPTPGTSQSAGASAAASEAASAAPSGDASAAPSAGASGGAGGSGVVDITASGTAWTTTDLTAPANAAFTIHFNNQDAGVPHNIVIKDGSGMAMFTSDLLTGAATADYSVPALPAGSYTFVCSVHTAMIGNLVVGP